MKKASLLLVCIFFLAGADDKPTADDVRKKLKGTWEIVMIGGEKPMLNSVVVFEGEKCSWKIGDAKPIGGTYTVDPSKKPAHIDLADAEKTTDVTECIYELEGDTLKLAFVIAPVLVGKGERPKGFNGNPSVIVMELKRKK